MKGDVVYLSSAEAKDFLLPKHYSGRAPNISYSFGWKIGGELVAVCTFGKPASNNLCVGICGEEHSSRVYELNRLCRVDDLKEQLSSFLSACLRRISADNLIIVSYSDTQMNHHGYIYQATNFFYTGCTKRRTDKYTEGNKHSRHYDNESQNGLRKVRFPKHRYVYFAMKDKRLRKECLVAMNYEILDYPKGDNSNYVLGEYAEPIVIKKG